VSCDAGDYLAWTNSVGGGIVGALDSVLVGYSNTTLYLPNFSTKDLVTRGVTLVHEAGHWRGAQHDGVNNATSCPAGASCDHSWYSYSSTSFWIFGGISWGGVDRSEALWAWAFGDSPDPRVPPPIKAMAAARAQWVIDNRFDLSPGFRVSSPINAYSSWSVYTGQPLFVQAAYDQGNSGPITDDWDYGFYKGVCDPTGWVLGMSKKTGFPGSPHALLCEVPASNQGFSGTWAATLRLPGDMRRANRLGDWDYGFYKLECGASEYIAGASMPTNGQNIHTLRCASGNHAYGANGNGCRVRYYDSSDGAGTGDWDYYNFKAECTPNEVVVGASYDPYSWSGHALLCCPK
jgi:hypothetical protein